MTTTRPAAKREAAPAGEDVPQVSRSASAIRGQADAALLVARVGQELARLAALADDIQRTLGAHVGPAVLGDPALMRQAQMLDLMTQSLGGLSSFLAGIGHHRIGREALDFEAAAASVQVGQLGDRLAGRSATAAADDVEFF